MKAQSLSEYIKNNPCKGFKAGPRYNELGNFIEIFWEDEESYCRKVNVGLDLYLSFEDNHVVGCKISGVKELMDVA